MKSRFNFKVSESDDKGFNFKHPRRGAVERQLPKERVVVVGNIKYADDSGQEAVLIYKEKNAIETLSQIDISYSSLSILGRKECYSKYMFGSGNIIKFIPSQPFTKHIFNGFRYKPNSELYCEIKGDKAYVITKELYEKIRRVQSNKRVNKKTS